MMTSGNGSGRDDKPKCGAKKRQPSDDGTIGFCEKPAGWGTDHPGIGRCRHHGGSTGNHQRAAVVEQARRAVALWGGRRDLHPAEALLELVGQKAMEVSYWRARVHEIQQGDEDALTFGVTKEKVGGDDRGTTTEAKPHIALTLLHTAERDLANYAAAALKAGVEERMVQLAQSTAGQFRQVIAAVLGDERLGVTAAADLVDQVVADALRRAVEG